MLAQRLRVNKEILVIDCAKPTTFRVMWVDLIGKQVRVGVDAEMSATIYRDYQEDTIQGLTWTCEPNGFVEVEARSPGIFQCQVSKVKDKKFDVTLQAPEDFLCEFIVEHGMELCW